MLAVMKTMYNSMKDGWLITPQTINLRHKTARTLPIKPPQSGVAQKRKLSYKEQRELEDLPNEIAALEQEQAQLAKKIEDGSWFNTDLAAATKAGERLSRD